ncbi:hypothetical protein A1F94_011959 [Pyrenophora tritici-repentis]|nr:hypothetical protein A1F94_011959 [Pyrenophora tritici-repentis]
MDNLMHNTLEEIATHVRTIELPTPAQQPETESFYEDSPPEESLAQDSEGDQPGYYQGRKSGTATRHLRRHRHPQPAGIGEPERLSELSSSGQKAFKEDLEYYRMSMEQYKSDRHRYEKEQSSFQHIMTLIQSSVSPHLLRTCCLPDKTLREWIANLQLTVGVDDETEKDRARERYLAALRPMRSAAQWDTWLAEYDQAATHAETYNVPELSQLSTTTKDFLAAVNKTAPIWATNFQDNGRGAVGMSRKEMMKRFREHMMINHPLRSGKHKAAMAAYDGPYGSTLAGGEYDQELSGTPHSSKSAPSTKMKPGQTR